MSICSIVGSGNMMMFEDQEAAAKYIPFIMKLIKPNLTLKEKLALSQNVYNAFLRQRQRETVKILTEKENTIYELKNNAQDVIKAKHYYLRF